MLNHSRAHVVLCYIECSYVTFLFVILQPTNFGITSIQHVIGTDHYQSKQFVGLKMIVIFLHAGYRGSSSQHFWRERFENELWDSLHNSLAIGQQSSCEKFNV